MNVGLSYTMFLCAYADWYGILEASLSKPLMLYRLY